MPYIEVGGFCSHCNDRRLGRKLVMASWVWLIALVLSFVLLVVSLGNIVVLFLFVLLVCAFVYNAFAYAAQRPLCSVCGTRLTDTD